MSHSQIFELGCSLTFSELQVCNAIGLDGLVVIGGDATQHKSELGKIIKEKRWSGESHWLRGACVTNSKYMQAHDCSSNHCRRSKLSLRGWTWYFVSEHFRTIFAWFGFPQQVPMHVPIGSGRRHVIRKSSKSSNCSFTQTCVQYTARVWISTKYQEVKVSFFCRLDFSK